MLTFREDSPATRHGVQRREFLQAGTLGLGGVTLAELLRSESRSETAGRPKSVIYVVLDGGPSHIDMYDLKPQAPLEYRGPFQPIATSLPGVQICEHMPLQAQIMDQLALLRGIRSVENDHYLSEVYTGLPRSAGKRPAFGSIISRKAGGQAGMPAYVSLNEIATDPFEYEKPFYMGAGHAPFRPFGESLNDMVPVKSVERLEDRRQLLTAFDGFRRGLDRQASPAGLDPFQAQALEIITSPKVRDAFDLSKEPAEVIERYGKGKYPHQTFKTIFYDWDAKAFVRARRLVEAGVRVVTLRVGSWDHHSGPNSDIFHALEHLLPVLDKSIHALVTDLRERGLDKDVLVVVLGEFGRTPKITPIGPGREHWADAGCAMLYGGGLRMGQVIGETDPRAERSSNGKISFQNIVATIYRVLGIEMETKIPDFNGRPQYVLEDREPIHELF
ncbi:MAG: hypothetical protein JWN70_2842 [Planctomycetaceae bacterium]|nr:hypothetical protein [Planctomycetaceae bacterium]